MRALVVFCHPKPDSYSAAVLSVVMDKLTSAGADTRLHDLYRDGFAPVMSGAEFDGYMDETTNKKPVEPYVADVQWADTLIFVYPTWWYGMPSMLKGWLDRVLLPGVAFRMPQAEGENIQPGLTHITKMGIFTTCGASWWLTTLIGAPGRRTLSRGVRMICAKRCKVYDAAHYLMDSSTDATRAAHLRKVGAQMERLTA